MSRHRRSTAAVACGIGAALVANAIVGLPRVACAQEVVWEGRFEMGDASVLFEIEVDEPGEVAAWLTGIDGRRRPTAIEAFELGPERVAFRLPEIERGYAFSGRMTSPARIEGVLERLPPEVPSTDLFSVEVSTAPGLVPWTIGEPRNLTEREGYDNQPRFLSGGTALLYTSMRDGQTDIYRYELASRTIRQVTDTPESEYSPTPLPSGNGFSTVRVESDGTQRLWAFDLDGSNPRLLLPDIEPVGYHAWIDERTVALFVLGEPPTLEIAELDSGESEVVAHNPGRSLHGLGDRRVLFIHEGGNSRAFARAGPGSDPAKLETSLLQPLPGREDFLVPAERPEILMGDGAKLFATRMPGDYPGPDEWGEWHQIADFSPYGVDGITRLALSPDGSTLVFVAERPNLSSFPERIGLTLVLADPTE